MQHGTDTDLRVAGDGIAGGSSADERLQRIQSVGRAESDGVGRIFRLILPRIGGIDIEHERARLPSADDDIQPLGLVFLTAVRPTAILGIAGHVEVSVLEKIEPVGHERAERHLVHGDRPRKLVHHLDLQFGDGTDQRDLHRIRSGPDGQVAVVRAHGQGGAWLSGHLGIAFGENFASRVLHEELFESNAFIVRNIHQTGFAEIVFVGYDIKLRTARGQALHREGIAVGHGGPGQIVAGKKPVVQLLVLRREQHDTQLFDAVLQCGIILLGDVGTRRGNRHMQGERSSARPGGRRARRIAGACGRRHGERTGRPRTEHAAQEIHIRESVHIAMN